ncbi:hypothetical protein [Streptomyces sp. NPDC048425]|uniref:hypothetical protein n=1 Tax=Streptomyces sp. NPDC048425 TaxID=3365548 RepID=UPI00371D3201
MLPVLLATATVMLLPLTLPGLLAHPPSPAQWAGIALLGGAVYAPAYLVQHRLILLKGPVFTAAVQLAVPFTVRIGDWALGTGVLRGPPRPRCSPPCARASPLSRWNVDGPGAV